MTRKALCACLLLLGVLSGYISPVHGEESIGLRLTLRGDQESVGWIRDRLREGLLALGDGVRLVERDENYWMSILVTKERSLLGNRYCLSYLLLRRSRRPGAYYYENHVLTTCSRRALKDVVQDFIRDFDRRVVERHREQQNVLQRLMGN